MTSEDDLATKLRLECEFGAGGSEVLLDERLGDGLERRARVGRQPRDGERFVVDVRRIDLHAPREGLLTERLAEHHRERVRLLARRASGAPDADGRVRARIDDRREPGGERLPCRRIPEERGHVDEQQVEELGELFRALSEVDEVLRERVDPHRRHPSTDASCEARSLVAREVEAPIAMEEGEQSLELVVVPPLGGWGTRLVDAFLSVSHWSASADGFHARTPIDRGASRRRRPRDVHARAARRRRRHEVEIVVVRPGAGPITPAGATDRRQA